MFVTVADATLFTTAFGDPGAPAILGMGGWIGSWELWVQPFARLSANWHTIAYDHRGTGATLAPAASITFDRLVEDVFCVLDAYQVERCYLAAESSGAAVALGAALRRPERVAGLIIVDGFYYSPPGDGPDAFVAALQANYDQALKVFVAACVPEPDCEHIKRWGLQILQRATPEAAIALYEMANGVDLRGEISRIVQPTLVIHGDADQIVPVAAAQWLAQTLPNAELVVLPGAGHVPTMTRPDAVVAEIVGFLTT